MLRRGIARFYLRPMPKVSRLFAALEQLRREGPHSCYLECERPNFPEGQIRMQNRAKTGRSRKLSSDNVRFVVADSKWKRQSIAEERLRAPDGALRTPRRRSPSCGTKSCRIREYRSYGRGPTPGVHRVYSIVGLLKR